MLFKVIVVVIGILLYFGIAVGTLCLCKAASAADKAANRV